MKIFFFFTFIYPLLELSILQDTQVLFFFSLFLWKNLRVSEPGICQSTRD